MSNPDEGILETSEMDERDEEDRRAEPHPEPLSPSFPTSPTAGPTAPPWTERASSSRLRVAVVNRALPDEAVPDCRIAIGDRIGSTDGSGNASIDFAGLADGSYLLTVNAPDLFMGPVGPASPADIGKERIWRPLEGRVVVRKGQAIHVEPPDRISVEGTGLTVRLTPVWLRSPLSSARSNAPDMIVIHHTAGALQGDLRTFLYGRKVSVHYLVAPDGEVYKLVADDRKASHAGTTSWQGQENLNGASIGIEITHQTGNEYPSEQVDAVVELVRRIKAAYPGIRADRVIGHSDIGICDPNSSKPCKPPGPKRLGRKSTDPGSAFPWERIEELGLSFQFSDGTVDPNLYGGFFLLHPRDSLRRGDSDALHRYGGRSQPDVDGAVRELQRDLNTLGYYCPPDGSYGQVTVMAVRMFQQHTFSGRRRTGRPDHWNSGNGDFDADTARYLKRAIGQVQTVAAQMRTRRSQVPWQSANRTSYLGPLLVSIAAVTLLLVLGGAGTARRRGNRPSRS